MKLYWIVFVAFNMVLWGLIIRIVSQLDIDWNEVMVVPPVLGLGILVSEVFVFILAAVVVDTIRSWFAKQDEQQEVS
jgi:hypothetical protein